MLSCCHQCLIFRIDPGRLSHELSYLLPYPRPLCFGSAISFTLGAGTKFTKWTDTTYAI